MPEAAMDKHNSVVLGKYEVWPSWEISSLQAVPESSPVQKTSYNKFGLRILRPDPAHDVAPDFRCEVIGHVGQSSLQNRIHPQGAPRQSLIPHRNCTPFNNNRCQALWVRR